MNPHEIHHIKAYVVFFLLSASLIGLLAYLYMPFGTKNTLESSVIQEDRAPIIPPKPVGTQSIEDTNTVALQTAEVSKKRMRLVKILIRYQKELQTLESQRSTSSQGLDTATEEKIIAAREKIATIEKLITEIQ